VKVLLRFPGLLEVRGYAGSAVRWPLLRPRPVPPVAVGPLILVVRLVPGKPRDWTKSSELQYFRVYLAGILGYRLVR
jgi:hypothetical protein